MKIVYDYEGASIKLLKNDKENNIIYLSLREEKDKFSHYYNFIIDNDEIRNGEIHIKNINCSQYYNKNVLNNPYIKIDNWKRLEKEEFYIDNNELIIKIKPQIKAEISLVPRYIEEDLKKFIKKISNPELKVTYEPIDEIIVGNIDFPAVVLIARQHPGETLSSFFIEGIIESILKSNNLLKKYCFIIYPIVNKEGVIKGVHRYTNGIDYNRSWNKKNAPKEIKYIKEQLKKYKTKYFIDIHNDEITSENYLRVSGKFKKDNIEEIQVLQSSPKLKRFVRALIRQKKIINIFSQSAREYIHKTYKCDSFLIELSMLKDYKDIKKLGYNFINQLLGE